jgi:ribosomal protein L37AE/L43A
MTHLTQTKELSDCVVCGDDIVEGRRELGYNTCLKCGEIISRMKKHTIAPMHKSNYMVITNLTDLHGLNNKGGLVK